MQKTNNKWIGEMINLILFIILITKVFNIPLEKVYQSAIINKTSLCDLNIATEEFIILNNCLISPEWGKPTSLISSENTIEVYEDVHTPRRVFKIEYKSNKKNINAKDIIFLNMSVSNVDNNGKKGVISIKNNFPYVLKLGDSFDVIIEYNNDKKNTSFKNEKDNTTINNKTENDTSKYDTDPIWMDILINIQIQYEYGGTIEIKFNYIKILNDDFKNKTDLTYFVLVISYILILFLSRNRFLIDENHFVQIKIEKLFQVKNTENIFAITGIILVIICFFIVIGYIYIITFIFGVLMAVISVKSFIKYLLKIISPSLHQKLENHVCNLYSMKLDIANVVCYILGSFFILFWYLSEKIDYTLHLILNNFIVLIVCYFGIHKINWKKFYNIIILFFFCFGYQICCLIFDDNNTLRCDNDYFKNVYYLSTKMIIDVPIRFILTDLNVTPLNQVYYFNLVDILFYGYIVQYCDQCYELNPKYLIISVYSSFIGLAINIVIFYTYRLLLPMSMIPLSIVIVSLIFYSLYSKECPIFMNLYLQKAELIKRREKEEENISKINMNYNRNHGEENESEYDSILNKSFSSTKPRERKVLFGFKNNNIELNDLDVDANEEEEKDVNKTISNISNISNNQNPYKSVKINNKKANN